MRNITSKMSAALITGASKDDQTLQNYLAAQETDANKGWLDQLDEHGVEFVILDLHGDSDLAEILRLQPAWTVDFEDGEAVIFARAASRLMH